MHNRTISPFIFQGGLAGLAGHFPPRYMGSMVQGQAVGGIFAAATNVVLLALGADEVAAAFYCFLVAVIFLSTALIAFFVLTRSEFFQFYANGHHHQDEMPENDQLINNENTQQQQAKPKVNIMFILSRVSRFLKILCEERYRAYGALPRHRSQK